MLWVLVPVAMAGEPDLHLSYRHGLGRITATAPGEHVSPEAPVRGWIESGEVKVVVETDGRALVRGLAVDLSDPRIEGTLQFSLCEDGGTACRMVSLSFAGKPEGKKGTVTLALARDEVEAGQAFLPQKDDVGAAFTRAMSEGKPVLLDFGAVWCPPCNRMAVEVIHHPAHAELLSTFVLAQLDADDPSSFETKDRYAVGGYPTVVAARADGTEIDRMVGYTSAPDMVAWLESVAVAVPLGALPEALSITPEAAATVALRLVRAEQEDRAEPYFERAKGADTPALHLARMLREPSVDEAQWLVEHDVAGWDWVYGTFDLVGASSELRASLRRYLTARLLAAPDGVEAAEAASSLAMIASEGEAPALNAAAAKALEDALTGDADLDRGHYSALADLYVSAGDVDRARALLEKARTQYPNEFTFHWQLAHLLLAHGQGAQAVEPARAALEHGYGDNQLRAAKELALALHATGEDEEALAVVDRALAEAVRPGEGVEVRTTRYLKALTETRSEIAGGPPTQ